MRDPGLEGPGLGVEVGEAAPMNPTAMTDRSRLHLERADGEHGPGRPRHPREVAALRRGHGQSISDPTSFVRLTSNAANCSTFSGISDPITDQAGDRLKAVRIASRRSGAEPLSVT